MKDKESNRSMAVVTPEVLVQGVVGLVSLPEVCIRISEMVDDPKSSANQIGRMISQDASLTARLLRIVNSAFYQFPSKVETVSRAITIVGNRELRDLVLAATVSGIFERISSDLVDVDRFWRHGIYTGILSKIIARKCRVLHSERLFVAGLLHDIGKLILYFKLPALAREAQLISAERKIPIHTAETEIFGYTHADVGAHLMRVWGLPESHQATTLYHHCPELADKYALESAIVYLSDRLGHLAESGQYEIDKLEDVPSHVWALTNISEDNLEEVLVEAREQFIEALQLFRPKGNRSNTHAA